MTPPTHQDHNIPHPQGGQIGLSALGLRAGQKRFVLAAHGLGSKRWGEKSSALAWACADRGWGFATADFRGHGASGGTLSELRGSGLQADLDAVVDWLRSRGVDRVCLAGSSMGAWASAWFAVRRPEVVRACVLICPALDFIGARWNALSEAEREEWQRSGRLRVHNEFLDVELGYGLVEEREQFLAERLQAELKTPALIIHGLGDEVVPWSGSLAFVERAASERVELHLIKSGNHRLTGHEDDVADLACNFFARG
jgi:uncharacterized protein